MRFIPTQIHAIIDYLSAIVLIAAPWILGFGDAGAATWIPVIVGATIIFYSLFTDYELGVSRQIDMGTHLTLDAAGGAFLALSPWLFGFDELVWVPHLVIGLFEIVMAICTQTRPSPARGEPMRTA